jgi:hypothetical protein
VALAPEQFNALLEVLRQLGPARVIPPDGVYTLPEAAAVVRVPPHCLPREIKLGRLEARKRGGRYYILGKWLINWLSSGAAHRRWRETAACRCQGDLDAAPEAAN